MFTYSTNVPQSAQKISATQAPIQSNFQAINELFNVNHVGFGDSVNFGKHNFTTLPFQISDPSTASNEMALYAKATGTPNAGEIFARYPSNGSVIQISGSSAGSAGASTNGWSYLPGNILMKWGQATGIIPGANTIVYPTSGSQPSFTTSVFMVEYTPASNYTLTAPYGYITGQTTTQFILNVPNTMSSTISWLAIGV
jgi:hypothetical protein